MSWLSALGFAKNKDVRDYKSKEQYFYRFDNSESVRYMIGILREAMHVLTNSKLKL